MSQKQTSFSLKSILFSIANFVNRSSLLLLALFVLLVNLPYQGNTHVPVDDTLNNFLNFYYFYNNFYFNHQLAQWIPTQSFGMPAIFSQINNITPFGYLMMLLGSLFKIKNVLWAYKMTIVLEQLVLVLGIYLLGKLLFKRKITTFVLSLGALLALYWNQQIYFNFRIFYMFPLALYFYLLFFQKKKCEYLWITGIVLIVWMMGSCAYFIFLWSFIFFIIGFVLFLRDRNVWRCLGQFSIKNVLLLSLLILITFSVFYPLISFSSFVDIPMRGPNGHTGLQVFISYGGVRTLGNFLEYFVVGKGDLGYMSLLLLFCFIWSLLRVRNHYYYAFLAGAVTVFLLSNGGFFTVLAYFFPTMSYYRHVGLTHGLLKVLLLICAGFGLEDLWRSSPKEKIKFLLLSIGLVIFLLDALGVSDNYVKMYVKGEAAQAHSPLWGFESVTWRVGVYLGILALVFIVAMTNAVFAKTGRRIFKDQRWDNIIKVLLVAAFLIDVASVQWFYHKRLSRREEKDSYADVVQVHQEQFQEQRYEDPQTPRQQQALKLISRRNIAFRYVHAYSFMQFDPCKVKYRSHFEPVAMKKFFATRKDLTPDLLETLGCYAPKLRILPNAIFASSEDMIDLIMRQTSQISDVAIIEKEDQSKPQRMDQSGFDKSLASATVKDFSANQISVETRVDYPRKTWLVYADAYHPGWKAKVNGKSSKVYKAYMAFKAVEIPPGKSVVEFDFSNGLTTICSYLVGIFGIIFSLFVYCEFFKALMGFYPLAKKCSDSLPPIFP